MFIEILNAIKNGDLGKLNAALEQAHQDLKQAGTRNFATAYQDQLPRIQLPQLKAPEQVSILEAFGTNDPSTGSMDYPLQGILLGEAAREAARTCLGDCMTALMRGAAGAENAESCIEMQQLLFGIRGSFIEREQVVFDGIVAKSVDRATLQIEAATTEHPIIYATLQEDVAKVLTALTPKDDPARFSRASTPPSPTSIIAPSFFRTLAQIAIGDEGVLQQEVDSFEGLRAAIQSKVDVLIQEEVEAARHSPDPRATIDLKGGARKVLEAVRALVVDAQQSSAFQSLAAKALLSDAFENVTQSLAEEMIHGSGSKRLSRSSLSSFLSGSANR